MPYSIGRLTWQGGAPKALKKRNSLRTGCSISESGVYRVIHAEHRLPREITLIKDQSFPRCSKCAEPVYFELVRSAPFVGANPKGFTVMLYELPELSEQDESLAG